MYNGVTSAERDEEFENSILELFNERCNVNIENAYLERFSLNTSGACGNYGSISPTGLEATFRVNGAEVSFEIELSEEEYEEYIQHDPEPEKARRFELRWTEDEAEAQDSEILARGIAYPDGSTHVQWNDLENDAIDSESNSATYNPGPSGVEDIQELDQYQAEFRWIDEEADND